MAKCSVPKCGATGPTKVLFDCKGAPFHFCLSCAPVYWALGYEA